MWPGPLPSVLCAFACDALVGGVGRVAGSVFRVEARLLRCGCAHLCRLTVHPEGLCRRGTQGAELQHRKSISRKQAVSVRHRRRRTTRRGLLRMTWQCACARGFAVLNWRVTGAPRGSMLTSRPRAGCERHPRPCQRGIVGRPTQAGRPSVWGRAVRSPTAATGGVWALSVSATRRATRRQALGWQQVTARRGMG